MATTTKHKIYYPVSTDEVAPLETVFATTASSVDAAITAANADLQATVEEQMLKTQTLPSPLNGYTNDPGMRLMKMGSLVLLNFSMTRSSGVTAVNMATIPAGLRPLAPITTQFVASQGGSAQACTVVFNTDGTIRNWTNASPNQHISGNLFWLV